MLLHHLSSDRLRAVAHTALAAALAASGVHAQTRTWVVDDGWPGGDFKSIQAAVDAAAPGDTVFVRPGHYFPFVVSGKGIAVIGEDPRWTRVEEGMFAASTETVTIVGVPAGEIAVIRGFGIQNDHGRLRIDQCAGEVWIEDCELDERFDNDFSNWGIVATDVDGLTLNRVRGDQGVWLASTNARLYACEFEAEDQSSSAPSSTPALPGLRVDGGSAFLAGNAITGGMGKPSVSTTLCGANPGGVAVELIGANPIVHDLDNLLEGGRYGFGIPCPDAFAPAFDVQAGVVIPVDTEPRSTIARPIALPGDVLRIYSRGVAGDVLFRYAGLGLDPTLLLSINGVGLLSAFLSLPPVETLGSADGVVDYAAPALPTAVGGLQLFLQSLHLGADGTDVLSSGSSSFVVQPQGAVGATGDCDGNGTADGWDIQFGDARDRNRDGVPDGCQSFPVLWVDDDAPGDPGPNDPTLSDPFEDGSLAAPFDSVQEAIDALPAQSYGIVRLRDGVYSGVGNVEISFGGRDLALESENGPSNCTLDGMGAPSAIYLNQDESRAARIEGLTITGCSLRAVRLGAGSPTIFGCRFVGNTGDRGAAISALGGLSPSVAGSHAVIVACDFIDNEASFGGGALYFGPTSTFNSDDDHRTLEVRDCRFESNRAPEFGGGAVYLSSGGGNRRARFTRCEFIGNTAAEAGGALYTAGGAIVEDSLFVGNRAGSRGGAGEVAFGGGQVDVDRCTFVDNQTDGVGGFGGNVFYASSFVTLNARDSIFWDNGGPADGFDFTGTTATTLRFEHCLLQGGASSIAPEPVFSFDSMKFGSPQFADAAGGDFSLLPGSVAIDAGRAEWTPRILESDLAGAERLAGTAVDLGAFEAP